MLEQIDAVDADFRVFYRVEGIADGILPHLSGPRFIRMCEQLPGYQGAVRYWVEREVAKEAEREVEEQPSGTTVGRSPRVQGGAWTPAAQVQEVPAEAAPAVTAFGPVPELNQPPIFEVRKAQ